MPVSSCISLSVPSASMDTMRPLPIERSCLSSARQRVIAQWIEAFWLEGLLQGEWLPTDGRRGRLALHGMAADGTPVRYVANAVRSQAFGRLRLLSELRRRRIDGKEAPATDLAIAVSELTAHHPQIGDADRLQFVRELEQTGLFHALALQYGQTPGLDAPYHELESRVGDGHRYHPCFKSRQGFDVADDLAFGPEFARPIRVIWLALRREHCQISALPGFDYRTTLQEYLGAGELARLEGVLREAGGDPSAYQILPAHPWHWLNAVLPQYADWLERRWMVCLGEGRAEFWAQQSLRSLPPLADPSAFTLKLPLAIRNSSADRILSSHHTYNAPFLTEWLSNVLGTDPYFSRQNLVVLGEVMGITHDDPELPAWLRKGRYGLLGAIWRDSPLRHLQTNERAVPMTALCSIAGDGKSVLAPWLARHGTEVWIRALFDCVLVPFFRLMAVHGVLLEAHMQNTILIVRDGLPVRVAIRDLHGGLHYTAGLTTHEAALSALRHPPAFRNALNASSGFAFPSVAEARDYLLEVLLFIHFSELAWHLHCHHGISEQTFWHIAEISWREHCAAWPEHAARFSLFDVYVPSIQLECLAGRRLFGWSSPRSHAAANPLYTMTGVPSQPA